MEIRDIIAIAVTGFVLGMHVSDMLRNRLLIEYEKLFDRLMDIYERNMK